MARCKDCIHDKICDEWAVTSGIPFVNSETCEHFKPTADVVPKSEVIKEFAERLKKYYSHLDGKSPTPLIVYHIDQIEKEMLEGIKKGAADTHNDQRDTAD